MPKTKDEKLDQMVEQITTKVVDSLDDILLGTLQKEITKVLTESLSRALKEGQFFRKVNDDMREGLESIYKEISKTKKDLSKSGGQEQTNELINEASDQLDAILKSTEDATVQIMDIVERHQETIIQAGKLLDTFKSGGASKDNVNELIELNQSHQADLMEIMTALSFQDLTGQRIKKIITALKKIEKIVFDVYIATGIKVKRHDNAPEKDEKTIEKEAKTTVKKLQSGKVKGSELKGPTNGTSQDDVDDLLAQLGL